ncbi:MAG: hypothetical protein ABI574_10150 [Burkholderiales bacterium]
MSLLNTKPKRSQFGRPSRFAADAQEREESTWSSHAALPAPALDLVEAAHENPRTRLLRTADDKPTAPKLLDLFPRETRSIDGVITFWDPGNTWPVGALGDLLASGTAGVTEHGSTRLANAETQKTFALIHHTTVPSASGQLYAVLHVEASAAESASADVALMLLERSDHAVVLTGGAAEHRDLPKRLQDFCRQAAWRGSTLQFIAPQDKPSRADRLRKISWPRSLRVLVHEMPTEFSTGWLTEVLARVADGALALPSRAMPAGDAAEPTAVTLDKAIATYTDEPLATLAAPESPPRPGSQACTQALDVAALTPGLAGAAVIDAYTQIVVAHQGDLQRTEAGVHNALQMWNGYANDGEQRVLSELVWTIGPIHHVVLPVPQHPGLLLLSMVDREFGDLARARWQLDVARNALA